MARIKAIDDGPRLTVALSQIAEIVQEKDDEIKRLQGVIQRLREENEELRRRRPVEPPPPVVARPAVQTVKRPRGRPRKERTEEPSPGWQETTCPYTREELIELYSVQEMSGHKIAKATGVSAQTIYNWLHKIGGIELRNRAGGEVNR